MVESTYYRKQMTPVAHCRLTSLCVLRGQISQSDGNYVRPQLTEHGPMAIVEGRHPLVEQLMDTEYQANDTYLAGALPTSSIPFALTTAAQQMSQKCMP